MFACIRGPLCEEVSRSVSDQAETDEEIHALCKTLIAIEGQAGS
jgi:hypothetical protein